MDNKSVFDKWFKSEIAIAFTVGLAVASTILWFFAQLNPLNTQIALLNQSIDSIKNNDLTHIELEITTINSEIATFQTQQNSQDQQLTEILTILKKN